MGCSNALCIVAGYSLTKMPCSFTSPNSLPISSFNQYACETIMSSEFSLCGSKSFQLVGIHIHSSLALAIMADVGEEDDYLSDKFLASLANSNSDSTASTAQTYASRRLASQRRSEALNRANRKKSRREMEQESLAEGLSVSLFERARREEEERKDLAGRGGGSWAVGMMKRMGFVEGGTLGRREDEEIEGGSGTKKVTASEVVSSVSLGAGEKNGSGSADSSAEASPGPSSTVEVEVEDRDRDRPAGLGATQHRKVPLAIDIWSGPSIVYRILSLSNLVSPVLHPLTSTFTSTSISIQEKRA